MQKIKIAIIDNGVDEAALGNEISGKVYVNEKKECVYDEADMSRVRFAHGTICAAIIQKYLANSEIYSIRLLNEDGSGLIEHLKPALDWCIEKGIYLVNLSLGTTHFRDKSLIRTLVNHYVSKGMCIVAATSNSGYESYPASFSNIIGVATHSSFFSDSLKRLFFGINILGESEHTLRLYGVASVTQKCNSYAAPFVTAYIGMFFMEQGFQNITKLYKRFSKKETMITISEKVEPDWICCAVIKANIKKSKADYYFDVVGIEEINRADTLIIDNLSDLELATQYRKNVVYVGSEKIKETLDDCFYWCPNKRVQFIDRCTGNEQELDIPIIVFEVSEKIDVAFLLAEFKKDFADREYNIYTAGLEPEYVLYGLEYVPEQCLSKVKTVKEFIYWQTFYMQSDGVLFCISEGKHSLIEPLFSDIDVMVRIENINNIYLAEIQNEDIVVLKISDCEIDKDFVEKVTNCLVRILTEEEDG